MHRRSGFTLIEILIVVAIIGVMLVSAVVNVASGRDAARVKTAARGVAQLSHYANAIAVLRQRPAVITYKGGTISVKLSGEGVDTSEVGARAMPIYREVNGETTEAPVDEDDGSVSDAEASDDSSGDAKRKESAIIHTDRVMDLENIAKEDAERTFEGVIFRVEAVDEEGHPLDKFTSIQLKSEAEALLKKRSPAGAAWSNTSGEIDLGKNKEKEGKKPEVNPENEGCVIYETNGNCTPYIVHLFAATGEDGNEEGEELMVVHVARSGKVTIGDDEDDGKRRNRR